MPPAQPPVRRALLGALLAAAVTLGSGCMQASTVRVESRTVRVTLDEYAIMPQDISVRAGRVEFVARNAGRLTHNLRIEVPRERGEPLESLGGVPTAQPGTTERGTVRLEPGTYTMRCTLANHDDLGQYGTLRVRAAGS